VKFEIIESTRINIDYTEEYKDKLWRFYIKDDKYISKKGR
jgi:DNA-3-methyladenine glycosylase